MAKFVKTIDGSYRNVETIKTIYVLSDAGWSVRAVLNDGSEANLYAGLTTEGEAHDLLRQTINAIGEEIDPGEFVDA